MRSQYKLFLTLLLLTLPYAPNAVAVDEYSENTQAIVDKIRDITEKARTERAADRWLLRSLDELVAKYEWPWRHELLFEDFSDGDFTKNPSWKVMGGEFWVDATLGLRSHVRAREDDRYRDEVEEEKTEQSSEDEQDIGSTLLGALLSEALQSKKRKKPKEAPRKKQRLEESLAEIHLPLQIPPAFAFHTEFSAHNAPSEDGQLQFALYQSQRGDFGYILTINTGRKPSLQLFQRFRGRSMLIETVTLADLNDGQPHELAWRMTNYGDIELLLDQQSLLQSRDRGFSKGFNQLVIINQGGGFGVRSIQLQGGSQ